MYLLQLGPLSLHLQQSCLPPPRQCIVCLLIIYPIPFRCECHPLVLQLHLIWVVTSIWHNPLHLRKGTRWLPWCRNQNPAWRPHLCLPWLLLTSGWGQPYVLPLKSILSFLHHVRHICRLQSCPTLGSLLWRRWLLQGGPGECQSVLRTGPFTVPVTNGPSKPSPAQFLPSERDIKAFAYLSGVSLRFIT